MKLLRVHHVALICSDYARSRRFYTELLGFHLDHQNLPAFGQVSLANLKLILSGPGASGSELILRLCPPRNLADPNNRAKSRGLGLALFPNTRDSWPDDRLGQWTFVWDLLIPASSWNSPTAGEFLCPLLEDNHNNDQAADMFIRKVNGQAVIGYQTEFAAYLPVPQIQPGQWFRLALVSDGYRLKQGRLFVNGQFVGTTGGDWTYASTKSADPRFGDISSSHPLGTPVPAATWNSWGQFPSPWALSPNASGVYVIDLQGRRLTLDTCRVYGTLVLKNASGGVRVTGDGGALALQDCHRRGIVLWLVGGCLFWQGARALLAVLWPRCGRSSVRVRPRLRRRGGRAGAGAGAPMRQPAVSAGRARACGRLVVRGESARVGDPTRACRVSAGRSARGSTAGSGTARLGPTRPGLGRCRSGAVAAVVRPAVDVVVMGSEQRPTRRRSHVPGAASRGLSAQASSASVRR